MKAMTVHVTPDTQAHVLPVWLEKLVVVMALPLLSLVGLVLAVIIRLTSDGPVFLSRSVIGQGGEVVTEYRFRCVYTDATQRQWKAQTLGEASGRDPRVTPVGAFMLASGFNKLPRLLNVLKGELNLMGQGL